MATRLGELLVKQGLITSQQRDTVLDQQRIVARPFGLLAEEMHGVAPKAVEEAWAEQFAEHAEWIDPLETKPSQDALSLIESRQAWQFGVIPIRLEEGELEFATTVDRLPRALRFAGWRVPIQCSFSLCTENQLSAALESYYPMAGLNTQAMQALRIAFET